MGTQLHNTYHLLSLWGLANSHIPRWLHITIPFKIIILGLTDTIYRFKIYKVSVAMHMDRATKTLTN